MNTETYMKIWIEGKISHLEGKIKEEVERTKIIHRPDGSLFPNMGTTETIKYHSQIKVLKELQEFLEDIDENLE